jgi:hypothetical protein
MARRRARRRDFVAPVCAVEGGWIITLDDEERGLLLRLFAELRALLEGPDDSPLLRRLFPTAYPDDDDKEAEYQRLMRSELVTSRLAAIDIVSDLVAPSDVPRVLDEGETIAFMQSINAIRLVLGSMLGIDDDDSADAADGDESPEYQLYAFLSWLLEWTVQALSPG